MVKKILRWRPSKEFVPRIQALQGTFGLSKGERNYRYFFMSVCLLAAALFSEKIYKCDVCPAEKLYLLYGLVFLMLCCALIAWSSLRYRVEFSEGTIATYRFGSRKSWEESLMGLVDVNWYTLDGVRFMDLHWVDRKRTFSMPDDLWLCLVEKDLVRPADWGKAKS